MVAEYQEDEMAEESDDENRTKKAEQECREEVTEETKGGWKRKSLGDGNVVVMAEHHTPIKIYLRNCLQDGAQLTYHKTFKWK